jgi:NAD+ synthase (glutamine-hydrolysing)
MGPALWLWDYLRRSGARGFFLPLSGGADSASTAAIVASMAQIVLKSIESGNQGALADLRRIVADKDFVPKTY